MPDKDTAHKEPSTTSSETPMEEKKSRIRPVVIEEVVPETPQETASEPTTTETAIPEAADSNPEPINESENSDSDNDEGDKETDEKPKKHRGSFKLVFIITILTALVVGFVLGGIYVYFTGVKTIDETDSSSTPTPEATSTPTPTPKAEDEEVDVTKYEVSILNGSGKIGEAGKAKDLLEAADFVVENTANADSFDFEETKIEAKKGVSEGAVDLVVEALEDAYTVDSDTDTLKSSAEYDIVVTVGSTAASTEEE